MELLERGGLLHDIGKIGVPGAVLDKPGRLTEEERRMVEAHTVIGARIVEPISGFGRLVPIVRHHHERVDGTGYPDGLAAEEIHLLARIVAVADVFDALTSERPYRAAAPHSEALAFLEQRSGSMFDPPLVEAFLRVMRNGDPVRTVKEDASSDASRLDDPSSIDDPSSMDETALAGGMR
jgi:putative nucleotidyltransferase with HDIG domain